MTNRNKNNTNKRVVIIGAGIAGLCAAVYSRQCGYEVVLLEQAETAGGLATNWRRGEYTFENCLHWLLGSSPNNPMHAQWADVFDIDKLTFIDPEEAKLSESSRDSGEAAHGVDRIWQMWAEEAAR